MIRNSKRIIPTSEEINSLKEKLSNIKDLNIVPPQNYIDPFIKRHPRSTKKKGMNKSFNVPMDRELSLFENNTRSSLNKDRNNLAPNNTKSTHLEELLGIGEPISSTKTKNEIIYKNSQESISFRNIKSHDDSIKVSKSKNHFEANSKRKNYSQIILTDEEEKKIYMKYGNNSTISNILKDYTNVKAELILNKKRQEENEKHILNVEKENKFLRDLHNSVPINKSSLKYFVINLLCNKVNFKDMETKRMLSELFTNENSKSKIDFVRFLNQRVDALELQNFHLISKIEKNNNSMKSFINELNEFYEVISDIRNVVNQVYESQTLTTEFMIIRDTLNNKINHLIEQKEINSTIKEKIEKEETKLHNMNVLLCKDKIVETKVYISNYGATNSKNSMLNMSTYSNNNNNKIFELLDEKIDIYENLKNNIAQYEDNLLKEKENNHFNLNMSENLMNENYLLKTKNIKLIKILYNLFNNNELDLTAEQMNELNELMNGTKNFIFTEDLFNIVKSQAALIENIIDSQN